MSEKAKFTKLFATWRSVILFTLKFKLMERTSKLFPITTWSKSSLNSVSPVTKRMEKRRRETLKIKVKKKKWLCKLKSPRSSSTWTTSTKLDLIPSKNPMTSNSISLAQLPLHNSRVCFYLSSCHSIIPLAAFTKSICCNTSASN